uniref:Uncharacterized protein n=1 Tax=Rhizophora mucronata TaxID=61149 RepID=A0A2P2QWB1_RHIMU
MLKQNPICEPGICWIMLDIIIIWAYKCPSGLVIL